MAWQVCSLPNLVPTSSGAVLTNAIGNLDDAEAITIFIFSTRSTSASLLVSQFDPGFDPAPGTTLSTVFYTWSTAVPFNVMATGVAYTISPVGFRGMRLSISSGDTGTASAFVTKQIFV